MTAAKRRQETNTEWLRKGERYYLPDRLAAQNDDAVVQVESVEEYYRLDRPEGGRIAPWEGWYKVECSCWYYTIRVDSFGLLAGADEYWSCLEDGGLAEV